MLAQYYQHKHKVCLKLFLMIFCRFVELFTMFPNYLTKLDGQKKFLHQSEYDTVSTKTYFGSSPSLAYL